MSHCEKARSAATFNASILSAAFPAPALGLTIRQIRSGMIFESERMWLLRDQAGQALQVFQIVTSLYLIVIEPKSFFHNRLRI